MRHLRRLPIALAHLAAAGLTARAAAAQFVMGRVVDSASRRPLPAVPMRLLRVAPDSAVTDTTPVARAYTARDGAFVLAAPAVGTYRVRIGDDRIGPPLVLASADSVDQHEYPIAPPDLGRALFEFQVDKHAASVPGTIRLRYPAALQAQNVEGKVTAQFVVDTTGRAEMSTWKVLESSHDLFSFASRDAVRDAQFVPAEVAGRKVRQLVQLPLAFSLEGGSASPAAQPLPYPAFPAWPARPAWPGWPVRPFAQPRSPD
jgi:TonB family protein